jgi:hypothetical protein
MDIRAHGFHGYLKLSGIGEPHKFSGSVMSITGEMLRAIQQTSPRKISGAKKIEIIVSDSPITEQTLESMELAIEVEGSLDSTLIQVEQPIHGEDIISFTARLINQGYSHATATTLAADAFDYEVPQEATQWLTDPAAIRLRQLHASQTAYDAADPQEAASLKSHCIRHYPAYVENMKLRD